jgi:Peptidase family M28
VKKSFFSTLLSQESAISLAVILLVAATVFLSLSRLRPPAAAPEGAPATEYSSARALKHLRVIASEPRPVGGPRHAQVRDYLLQELAAQGLSPEVQEASTVEAAGAELRGGSVRNVVARLEGSEGGAAVMLVSHYDSVASGPGASDDGAAVATMLETLRALKAGPRPRNDVIFLFTDGEEDGLLGAKAFVAEHPWVKDVKVVLNFEARGNEGPVIMFETSAGNGWLVEEFAAAAPHPRATSLSYEIYRFMPNITDMTVFKKAGMSGLNFAHIGGHARYHTRLDSVENLDERSLQHQGTYALSLSRHFGNVSLAQTRRPNAVYFNPIGSTFVRYSGAWPVPLTVLAALLFAAVVVLGFKAGRLTAAGIALGALGLFAAVAASAGVVWAGWWLLRTAHNSIGLMFQQVLYSSHLYALGFLSLTLAAVAALYNLYRKKITPANLTAGGLLLWLLLAVASALFVPGGSYLFLWPLFFGLLGLGYTFLARERREQGWQRPAVTMLCALPALLLFAPLLSLLYTALDLDSYFALAVLLTLLLGALLPLLGYLAAPGRWLLPAFAVTVGVGFFVAGSIPSAFDRQHPKPSHLFYGLNADSGKAVWASVDRVPNEWTAQFLTARPQKGAVAEYVPSNYGGFLTNPAPSVTLSAPRVEVLDDRREGGVRRLRLRLTSPREAGVFHLFADPSTKVLRATMNGKEANSADERPQPPGQPRRVLTYVALPKEGLELTLETEAASPVKLTAMDQSYGLPEIPGAAFEGMPDSVMPLPFTYNNSTLVSGSFTF